MGLTKGFNLLNSISFNSLKSINDKNILYKQKPDSNAIDISKFKKLKKKKKKYIFKSIKSKKSNIKKFLNKKRKREKGKNEDVPTDIKNTVYD